jgi:hypothetical protein
MYIYRAARYFYVKRGTDAGHGEVTVFALVSRFCELGVASWEIFSPQYTNVVLLNRAPGHQPTAAILPPYRVSEVTFAFALACNNFFIVFIESSSVHNFKTSQEFADSVCYLQ